MRGLRWELGDVVRNIQVTSIMALLLKHFAADFLSRDYGASCERKIVSYHSPRSLYCVSVKVRHE